MTKHVIKELPDGTRVYSNYTRYKPVAPEERKYRVNKPDVPGAVRRGGTWYLPLTLLDDDARVLPETRPDTDAYEHMSKDRKCMCFVCRRPESERWKTRWLKERNLLPGKKRKREKRATPAPPPPD